MQPNQVYASTVGNYIACYTTSTSEGQGSVGAGTLNVYTITPIGGWPILNQVAQLTNRLGKDWRKSGDDSLTIINSPFDLKSIPGDSVAIRFNNYWANLGSYINNSITTSFISSCTDLISNQSEKLKAYFKQNNNINPVSKQPYSAETGVPFNRTQYYLMIDSKITNKTARDIYNRIKDIETIQALGGKV